MGAFRGSGLAKIALRELIDPETGEVFTCMVSRDSGSVGGGSGDKDYGFVKVWLAPFLAALNAFSIKKLDVFACIMKYAEVNNIVVKSIQEIATEVGCSYQLAHETFQLLEKNDIVKREKNGVFSVNPSVIFNGRAGKRAVAVHRHTKIGVRKDGGGTRCGSVDGKKAQPSQEFGRNAEAVATCSISGGGEAGGIVDSDGG